MSIINDALKKAQENLAQKEEKQSNKDVSNIYDKLRQGTKYSNPTEKPSPKSGSGKTIKTKKTWYKTVVVLVCVFFVIIGVLLTILLNLMKESSSPPLAEKIAPVKELFKPKEKPVVKREYQQGELVLNGIMMMDDKRVALINDEIYQVGDFVQGRKVINITLKKVDLIEGDKIRVLKVK